jgi:ubiquinone/menaquinone biosynthesis C-methylase UbiE
VNPTQACKSAVPAEGQAVILDVACAGGEPALTIAQALPDAVVHATDYSAGMVAALQSRLQGEFAGKCANIIADTANGEQLQQFADSSVHAVTCSLGLMFMPNWQKALSEVCVTALQFQRLLPCVHGSTIVV